VIDSKDRQVVVVEGPGIADGLRVDEPAKGVALVRDAAIVGVPGHELEEPADRRAALVELPGGV
jgi:hypothetical protein